MFLLLDNYDSFTYNLWHFLGQLGADVKVVRNDKITAEQALELKPEGLIISPGPCDPGKAGISLEVIKIAPKNLPIFGVCLGHQCIGQAFGAKIVRSAETIHGKVSIIRHTNSAIFKEIPETFSATRYHSLIVDRSSLPECLEITAETSDGTIMAISHQSRPIHGVQFHPESIASEYGYTLLSNFLEVSGCKAASAEILANMQLDLLRAV
ncbi:MAG: aminodeoxychorismate/anthranilate synthase component II [Pseudomonadota bacterium]|nr:aminodeoxychorismate/anthranilate synthase component II [Pseudomonadota bacterium]